MELLVQIWRQYPAILEFLLYFLFFGTLSRTALTGHFGDRAAKRIAIPIGLALAAALVRAQDRIGFALEILGPFAAALIFIVLGVLVYRLLRAMDISSRSAFILATLFTVIGLRSAMPEFVTDRVNLSADWLLAGLLAWALAAWFVKESPKSGIDGIGKFLAHARDKRSRNPTRDDLKRAAKSIKRTIQRETKNDIRQGRQTTKLLRQAERKSEASADPSGEYKLESLLEKVELGASRVTANLARLRRLDKALAEADWTWLRRTMATPTLSPGQKRMVRANIAVERERLGAEKQIGELTAQAEAHIDIVRGVLSRAQAHAPDNDTRATRRIDEARQHQRAALAIEKRMLALEKRLSMLYRKQVKFVRAA